MSDTSGKENEQVQKTPEQSILSDRQKDVITSLQAANERSRASGAGFMRNLLRARGSDALVELNPLTGPGKDRYTSTSLIDENEFFKDRLKGKVLDVASNQTDILQAVEEDRQNSVIHTDIGRFDVPNFVQADAKALPFPDQSFDALYTGRFLDDGDAIREFFPELRRVVKEDGMIIIQPMGIGNEQAILKALQEQGIDTQNQCELTMNQSTLTNKEDPELALVNSPRLFITIRLGARKAEETGFEPV